MNIRLGRIVLATLFLAFESACRSSSYLGISLQSVEVQHSVRKLARQAQAGDKKAQYTLGTIFEEGVLIEKNLRKARILYNAAAKDDSVVWTYLPATRKGVPGMMMPFESGAGQKGIPEAKLRLKNLGR